MKQAIRILIILAIIALWLFANNELTETISIVLAILVIVALAIDLAKTKMILSADSTKGRHQKITALLLLFSSLFVLFAMWMRHEVVTEADEFSKQFIEKHACRPALSDLELNGEGWERKYPSMVMKTFKKTGASRTIIYRDMGLLRYGFLYEDKRSYIFPECKEPPA
jgi:hypothetical protein